MLSIRYSYWIFLLTCLSWISCSNSDTERTGRSGGPNVFPVRVMVIEPGPINLTYQATGTFEPDESVEITAERAGRIERLNFREGDNVGKGTPLAYIDDDEISSQIQTLEVQLSNAESNWERAQNLKSIDAISTEEWENIKYEKNMLSSQINELKVLKGKSVIYAPFSGKLGFREVSPGAYVNAGQKIVDLVSYHPLKATFSIPEEYANDVREKDTVYIQINKNTSYTTVIDKISPIIDPATRSFSARALIQNEKGNIIPGQFANVEIRIYDNPQALLVPAEAITHKLGGAELFVVKDGQAKTRNIETGVRNENFVEVLEGVEKGDSVIMTGLLSLSDGVDVSATVSPVKADQ